MGLSIYDVRYFGLYLTLLPPSSDDLLVPPYLWNHPFTYIRLPFYWIKIGVGLEVKSWLKNVHFYAWWRILKRFSKFFTFRDKVANLSFFNFLTYPKGGSFYDKQISYSIPLKSLHLRLNLQWSLERTNWRWKQYWSASWLDGKKRLTINRNI